MKKFAIMKAEFELSPKHLTTIEDGVVIYGREYATTEALVDTLEEARKILAEFRPFTSEHRWNFQHCYCVKAAYIEEGEYEYDEDYASWEFISSGDIWDVNCMELPTETEEKEDED